MPRRRAFLQAFYIALYNSGAVRGLRRSQKYP